MNKQKVERLLPLAVETLRSVHDEKGKRLVTEGKIKSSFRGQISSFGAAVASGSLLAAVAFFSDQGGSEVERPLLMLAIRDMLVKVGKATPEEKDLFHIVQKAQRTSAQKIKEDVLCCAVALKLAMNLFELEPR